MSDERQNIGGVRVWVTGPSYGHAESPVTARMVDNHEQLQAELTALRAQLASVMAERDQARDQLRQKIEASIVTIKDFNERITRLRALAKVVASESVHSLDRCGCLSAADKLKPLIAACDAHHDLDEGGE